MNLRRFYSAINDYGASLLLTLLIFTVLAIYSNIINAPFVFDDRLHILNNPVLKDWGYFGDATKILDGSVVKCIKDIFINRFIGYFAFAINYNLTEFDTSSYHITNIVRVNCKSNFPRP